MIARARTASATATALDDERVSRRIPRIGSAGHLVLVHRERLVPPGGNVRFRDARLSAPELVAALVLEEPPLHRKRHPGLRQIRAVIAARSS